MTRPLPAALALKKLLEKAAAARATQACEVVNQCEEAAMATGSAALSVGHEVASDSSSVLVEHQPAEEEDADQTQLPSSAPQQLLSAQPHSALPSMEVEAAAAAVQPLALAASSSASCATPAAAPTAAADGDADQPPAAALLSASSAVHSEDASATSAPAPSAPPSESAADAASSSASHTEVTVAAAAAQRLPPSAPSSTPSSTLSSAPSPLLPPMTTAVREAIIRGASYRLPVTEAMLCMANPWGTAIVDLLTNGIAARGPELATKVTTPIHRLDSSLT